MGFAIPANPYKTNKENLACATPFGAGGSLSCTCARRKLILSEWYKKVASFLQLLHGYVIVVRPAGFEPATSGLGNRHSIH